MKKPSPTHSPLRETAVDETLGRRGDGSIYWTNVSINTKVWVGQVRENNVIIPTDGTSPYVFGLWELFRAEWELLPKHGRRWDTFERAGFAPLASIIGFQPWDLVSSFKELLRGLINGLSVRWNPNTLRVVVPLSQQRLFPRDARTNLYDPTGPPFIPAQGPDAISVARHERTRIPNLYSRRRHEIVLDVVIAMSSFERLISVSANAVCHKPDLRRLSEPFSFADGWALTLNLYRVSCLIAPK